VEEKRGAGRQTPKIGRGEGGKKRQIERERQRQKRDEERVVHKDEKWRNSQVFAFGYFFSPIGLKRQPSKKKGGRHIPDI
jgi:hypothetical protein